jgi:hypothetical protein
VTRHLLTTLCSKNDFGHLQGRQGRCIHCRAFIREAPTYTIEQRLRFEQLRTEWLHERRELERG